MKSIQEVVPKTQRAQLPERVLQIGEGNFLRAFADWMIDKMNGIGEFNGSVVLCQPIAHGMADQINNQNGIYTVLMRGVENGEIVEKTDVVTSVSRCINSYADFGELLKIARSPELKVIISNTTEAGIAYHVGDKATDTPPASYPAKMAVILHERFRAFGGDGSKGLIVLPVELIDRNGDNLKKYVLQYAKEWNFSSEAVSWIEENVCFANTLVDRIVTGFPRDEIDGIYEKLGYRDNILVTCEPFYAWVIEAPKKWAQLLPFDKAGLHVVWTDDMTPYRTRKVRILNGAHTVSVLAAFLSGHDIVLEMMKDETFVSLLKSVLWNEVIPNIDLPKEELDSFAKAVLERFSNPFIKHRLLDISLNSVSKFKARCLDSMLEYQAHNGKLPPVQCFGLAALIEFYKGEMEDGKYFGTRNGERYEIRDDADILMFFAQTWKSEEKVAQKVLSNAVLWGKDLTTVDGLLDKVEGYLQNIEELGMKNAVKALMESI
jgi:tagaturonate reductase